MQGSMPESPLRQRMFIVLIIKKRKTTWREVYQGAYSLADICQQHNQTPVHFHFFKKKKKHTFVSHLVPLFVTRTTMASVSKSFFAVIAGVGAGTGGAVVR